MGSEDKLLSNNMLKVEGEQNLEKASPKVCDMCQSRKQSQCPEGRIGDPYSCALIQTLSRCITSKFLWMVNSTIGHELVAVDAREEIFSRCSIDQNRIAKVCCVRVSLRFQYLQRLYLRYHGSVCYGR